MKPKHLSLELLRAVAREDVSALELLELLFRHVVATCPECSQAVERFRDEREAQQLERLCGEGSGAARERFLAMARREVERRERLQREAERDLAELLALEPSERTGRVRRARKRFRNPELAHRLIEQCRERVAQDPHGAYMLAQLAVDVVLRLPEDRFGTVLTADLLTRAHAHRANALRAAGDLRHSEELNRFAWQCVQGSADPLVHAELLHLTASLRKDQRRFADADAVLEEALAIYRDLDDPHQVGVVLLNKADVLHLSGDFEAAVSTVEEAAKSLDAQAEPRLYLGARHNLGHYLLSLGRYGEAAELVESLRPLYDRYPEYGPKRRWLEAKIALGLGRRPEAEELFRRVREEFLKLGLGYHTALVSLDLALLYAEEGRTAELRQISEEMLPIFRSQDVHREAIAALLLFRQAVAAETVTAEMIRQLARYLEEAQRNPALQFEKPS